MYQKYMDNEQFNFQINRFLEPYEKDSAVQKVIAQTVVQIKNRQDWYEAWNQLAIKTAQKATATQQMKDYGLASAYYQLADFFLTEQDERKQATYQGYVDNFYHSIDTTNLIFEDVPYQKGILPVVRINHPHAQRTLLFHGGFDSYLEEMLRLVFQYGLADQLPNYNFVLFEGPGQGRALRSGLALTSKWEEPVGYLLDYYQLEAADLLGMSLGGYLSVRAAAKDHRIRRVIAYDAMLSLSDALVMKLPQASQYLDHLDDPQIATSFNDFLVKLSNNNVDLAFKMQKGMDITLTKQPVDFVKEALNYTLEGVLDEVTADVLLLGGTKDLYVPAAVTLKEAAGLVNARSLTVKILTEASGGARHCQVGDKKLAFQTLTEFLSSNNLMTNKN